MEYIRKCEVCGKIYCYTDKDIANNKINSINASISAVGTIASVMGGGSMLTSAYLNSQTDKYGNRVIDYTKCPNCNSTRTHLIEAGEEVLSNDNIMQNRASNETEFVESYEEAMADLIKLGLMNKDAVERELEKQNKIYEMEEEIIIANEQTSGEQQQSKEIRKRKIMDSIFEASQEIADTEDAIREQKRIVEANKMKLFGVGAKDKKEAQRKIAELEKKLKKLEVSEQKLRDDLENEKDFLEKVGLNNKEMTELPLEVKGKVRELEGRVSIQSKEEKFVKVYAKKRIVHSTTPEMEYADIDLYVNNEKIIMYKTVQDRTWIIILNDLGAIKLFDNLSMGIKGEVEVLEYKYIRKVSFIADKKYANIDGHKKDDYIIINFPREMKSIWIALKKLQERIKDEKISNDIKKFLSECDEIL